MLTVYNMNLLGAAEWWYLMEGFHHKSRLLSQCSTCKCKVAVDYIVKLCEKEAASFNKYFKHCGDALLTVEFCVQAWSTQSG